MIRLLASVVCATLLASCANSGVGRSREATTETRFTHPPSSKTGLSTLTIGRDSAGKVVSVR